MRFYVILALLLWTGASLGAAERDLIRFADGREMDVVIDKITATDVTFKDPRSGASQKRKVDDITYIVYEDSPPAFLKVIEFFDMNDGARALGEMNKLYRSQAKFDKKHHNYINYYFAYALLKVSESKPQAAPKAVKVFAGLEKRLAATRFGPDAKLGQGKALMISGDYEGARKIFEGLSRSETRPRLAVHAKALHARSYLVEKQYPKALNLCRAEIKAGNISGELMDVLAELLLEHMKDPKMAYTIGKKLAGKGGPAAQAGIYELKGCGAFYSKNHEEALDDLLRSAYLYGNGQPAGRVNVHLAATLKQLMEKDPVRFPEWEYRLQLDTSIKRMSTTDQKLYSKILKQ